jgi:hypothetical protein
MSSWYRQGGVRNGTPPIPDNMDKRYISLEELTIGRIVAVHVEMTCARRGHRGHFILEITERQMMKSYIGDIEEIQAHSDLFRSDHVPDLLRRLLLGGRSETPLCDDLP